MSKKLLPAQGKRGRRGRDPAGHSFRKRSAIHGEDSGVRITAMVTGCGEQMQPWGLSKSVVMTHVLSAKNLAIMNPVF